jgi:hypothetical protein
MNKENLYIGNNKVLYKIYNNIGICIRDTFGGCLGKEIYIGSDYKQCSIGSEETLKELKEMHNKYVKNRTYSKLV